MSFLFEMLFGNQVHGGRVDSNMSRYAILCFLLLGVLAIGCGNDPDSAQTTSTPTPTEAKNKPEAVAEPAADTAPGADTADQARSAIASYQGGLEYGATLPRDRRVDPEYNYYERHTGAETPRRLDNSVSCSLANEDARAWVSEQVVPSSAVDRKVEYLETVEGNVTHLYWRYSVNVPSDAVPRDGSAPATGAVQSSGMLILDAAGQPVYGERSDLTPPTRTITAYRFVPASAGKVAPCGTQR